MAKINIGNRKTRGVGSMSLSKHRKAGGPITKSPRTRHGIKREAEANCKSRAPIKDPKSSVRELLND